jgi:hypothetical protein
VKEGYGDGHLFLWRTCWENWEGTYARNLRVEEVSGEGVSSYRGSVGGPGERGPSNGNFDRRIKGSTGMWLLFLKTHIAEGLEGEFLYWVH